MALLYMVLSSLNTCAMVWGAIFLASLVRRSSSVEFQIGLRDFV